MRPVIGLADLLRAATQLDEDPAAIARVLALRPGEARASAALVPVAKAAVASTSTTGRSVADAAHTAATAGDVAVSMEPPQATEPTHSIEGGPPCLRALGRHGSAPPAWLPGPGEGLDLVAPRPDTPPPLETLFEPLRHRALISTALATLDDGGPLDLERLIEQLATHRLVRGLPRLRQATLHRGAWLLLDRSPAMAPFFDDVSDLAERIERVVGRELTRVQQFTARPDRVWDAARLEERALDLPPPGTPLVALTDLGLRSGGRGWRNLLVRLAARDSRAIAIVPYPVARVPAELRRLTAVVPWDRGTKVRAVRPRHRRTR